MTQRAANTTRDIQFTRATPDTAHEYQIHLNFLAVNGEFPSFAIHRRQPTTPQEPRPCQNVMAYRLAPRLRGNGAALCFSTGCQTGFGGATSVCCAITTALLQQRHFLLSRSGVSFVLVFQIRAR